MSPTQLHEHIHQSYHSLRRGIWVLGFMFPTVLLVNGLIGRFSSGIDLPNSLSSYYNYNIPMKNFYVGVLCAIGISLYLYKGFSTKEDRWLNWAGIFAFFTAVIPASLPRDPEQAAYTLGWLHETCAVLFFFCIGYVCIRLASESLGYREVKKKINTERYKKIYKGLGYSMWALPVSLLIRAYILKDFQYLVLWVEIAAVLVFSTYWLTKSIEFKNSDMESNEALDLYTTRTEANT
jgi:hypothetical protein